MEIIAYHGTRRKFSTFEPMQPSALGNPVGVYFTYDIRTAEEYAMDVDGAIDEKSRIIKVKLTINSDEDGKIINRPYTGKEIVIFNPDRIQILNDNILKTPLTESISIDKLSSLMSGEGLNRSTGIDKDTAHRVLTKYSNGNDYELTTLPMSKIHFDYSGKYFDKPDLSRLAIKHAISDIENDKVRPIIVSEKGEVLDGNHRALAHHILGKEYIQAYIPSNSNVDEFDNLRTRLSKYNKDYDSMYNQFSINESTEDNTILYHGSPYKFEQFDSSKISENGRSEGPGFYFTTDKEIALAYADGGYLYKVHLNIQNPITNRTRMPSRTQLKKLILNLIKLEMQDDDIEKYDTTILASFDARYEGFNNAINQTIDLLINEDNILDMIGSLIGMGIPINTVNTAINQSLGYDGYISNGFGGRGTDGGTIHIAMFPNQIHILDVIDVKNDTINESIHKQFINFLDKFKVYDTLLIESITEGYRVIFESNEHKLPDFI